MATQIPVELLITMVDGAEITMTMFELTPRGEYHAERGPCYSRPGLALLTVMLRHRPSSDTSASAWNMLKGNLTVTPELVRLFRLKNHRAFPLSQRKPRSGGTKDMMNTHVPLFSLEAKLHRTRSLRTRRCRSVGAVPDYWKYNHCND